MEYTKPGLYRRCLRIRDDRFYSPEDEIVWRTTWFRHDDNPEEKLDVIEKKMIRMAFETIKVSLIGITTEFMEYRS